jgi:putative oxidoreductase
MSRTNLKAEEKMRRWVAIRRWLDNLPDWPLQALMRFAIFWVFWRAGLLKADNMEQAVGLFRDEYLSAQDKDPIPMFLQMLLRVPSWPAEPLAWMATSIEIGASALILVGLATRLATVPLIAMTLFIQFFVYWRDYPSHLLWLAVLIFILVRGPGSLSIDAMLVSRVLRRV